MRTLKLRMHIFCEGKNAEPFYIQIERKFPGKKLEALEKCNKNTALQLVQYAVDRKGEFGIPDDDSFWVVYGREATNKYSNELHDRARDLALSNGIHIALSNVCFEIWILLHFQANVAPYTSFTNLIQRSRLKEYLPDYDKSRKCVYTDEQIAAARRHAPQVNERTRNAANRDCSWGSI